MTLQSAGTAGAVVAGRRVRGSGRSRFYLGTTLAVSFTAFLGFSFTYFGPLLKGEYPEVSATVHLHGWSFFLWYLLLPLQAGLIHARRVRVHRRLGITSLALATFMVVTGLTVVGVSVERSLNGTASPFWSLMGPGVFSTLLLFIGFYGAAIHQRRRPGRHRRLILLASTGALGAAAFRILSTAFGATLWTVPAGILAPNLFIVAAMIHEHRRRGEIHPIYRYGLPGSISVEVVMVGAGLSAAGEPVRQALAGLGHLLGPLY